MAHLGLLAPWCRAIPGRDLMRYRAKPADAGRSISMVGLGQYRSPNGVHAIDRRVTHKRIRWTQRLILSLVLSRQAVRHGELLRQACEPGAR